MCKQLSNKRPLTAKTKHARIKLWQLEHIYHCAIIGTCLTLDEVKKILNSLKVNFNQYRAYDIHINVVSLVSNNNFCSKKIQQHLDKKFASIIKNTRHMNASELQQAWKDALKTGDFIGMFWVIASHPCTDDEMRKYLYGDVHMLSHLSGASNRVDLKRLAQLEKEKCSFSNELSEKESQYQTLKFINLEQANSLQTQTQLIDELAAQVNALTAHNTKLTKSNKHQECLQLKTQTEKLEFKIIAQANEVTKHQRHIEKLTESIEDLNHQHLKDVSQVSIYKEELSYLQYQLKQQDKYQECALKKYNLCGQCVLYVGGKQNLIPHYRKLVEDQAGMFIHHDGGIEKTTQDLLQSLMRADIVVFPTNCISHDAYWKIKRLCKKQKKPYEYLSSAGVGSLFNTLNKLETMAA